MKIIVNRRWARILTSKVCEKIVQVLNVCPIHFLTLCKDNIPH
jgi:hypothetical protein